MKVSFISNTITPAAWAADGRGKDQLLPFAGIAVPAGFTPLPDGRVFIPAGTLVGRTFAERTAGIGFGPGDPADNELFLTVFDCYDALQDPELTFYRPGKVVKQNFLPNWATLAAGVRTKIQELYVCIEGVA